MTHDELLKKIDRIVNLAQEALQINTTPVWIETHSMLSALRAVVELHKPFLTDYPSYCLHCETYGSVVPCPTIQAIEKELS